MPVATVSSDRVPPSLQPIHQGMWCYDGQINLLDEPQVSQNIAISSQNSVGGADSSFESTKTTSGAGGITLVVAIKISLSCWLVFMCGLVGKKCRNRPFLNEMPRKEASQWFKLL